jgi:2-keto-4-pentenoate hydratase/2-oxohepta-3-ene-1,7-dioic acid hydratase in catechol pathway
MDKVLCTGLNYRQHAKECGAPIPEHPVIFSKFPSTLSAHGAEIKLLEDYVEYDYEAELVIVMGKAARNVSEADALDYVFGFTCGNDLSERWLQHNRGGQWILGKTLEGFGPIGPCVATADSVDCTKLDISCRVNGEERQHSNTSDFIFPVARLVADLSHHMTLLPGDIIFTGTPSGVMLGYPADQKN